MVSMHSVKAKIWQSYVEPYQIVYVDIVLHMHIAVFVHVYIAIFVIERARISRQ